MIMLTAAQLGKRYPYEDIPELLRHKIDLKRELGYARYKSSPKGKIEQLLDSLDMLYAYGQRYQLKPIIWPGED